MGRGRASVARWWWTALVASVCSALLVLVPSLLTGATAESGTLTLAVVTMALAALLRLDRHSLALARVGAGSRLRPTDDAAPLVLSGRVTDPVHHPLRPRAPGTD